MLAKTLQRLIQAGGGDHEVSIVSPEGHITGLNISVSQIYDINKDSDKLEYLEAGGVDNWDWYGDSLEEFWDFYSEIERPVDK